MPFVSANDDSMLPYTLLGRNEWALLAREPPVDHRQLHRQQLRTTSSLVSLEAHRGGFSLVARQMRPL
jgi:hypothetical protein